MLKNKVLLVMLTLLLSACVAIGPTIHSNATPQVNLNQYKSFGFFDKLDTDQRYESLLSQYLKASTKEEMLRRGFKFTQDSPDLLINFRQDVVDKQALKQFPVTHQGGYYSSGGRLYYDTWVGFEPYLEKYQQGILTIDIVDRQQNKMIWQGAAVEEVSQEKLATLDSAIPKIVNAIFEQFPITPTIMP